MTKKFGIIGNPIKHSLSPILHNYWFEKYKIDASYSIDRSKRRWVTKSCRKDKKQEPEWYKYHFALQTKNCTHLDILVNDAKNTSSVNTIYLDDQETIIGENTDVFGLQAAYLKEVDEISRKKALVIGAGGVSPSVILSLEKSGLKEISITNRTMEKCIFLKKKFNYLKIIEWENLKNILKNYDIIINATSLGLKNGKNFDFNFDQVKEGLIYIDTVYNPLETKTLKYLKKKKLEF